MSEQHPFKPLYFQITIFKCVIFNIEVFMKREAVKQAFDILIADRNPYIRKFLKREMMAEGYQIRLAENGRQVIEGAYHHNAPDILILDPDLPDADKSLLLKQLQNRIPYLPVVIHTFASDHDADILGADAVVKKNGNSVESLKQVVSDILNK